MLIVCVLLIMLSVCILLFVCVLLDMFMVCILLVILGVCVLLDMLLMCVMLDVAYYMHGSYQIHPSTCTMWLLCVHNFEFGEIGCSEAA